MYNVLYVYDLAIEYEFRYKKHESDYSREKSFGEKIRFT